MIHFFYGNDEVKKRDAMRAVKQSFMKENPNTSVFALDEKNWSEGRLDELLSADGLFGEKRIVVCENIFNTKDEDDDAQEANGAEEDVVRRTPEMSISPHCFVIIAKKANKKLLASLQTSGASVEKYSTETKKDFSVFALADALGERDKKKLWVLLQKEIRKESSAEEIIGTLFWKVKTMILAHGAKSASEAGLSPFVWSKANAHAKKWTDAELTALSSKLVRVFHDSHAGEAEPYGTLESFVLEL